MRKRWLKEPSQLLIQSGHLLCLACYRRVLSEVGAGLESTSWSKSRNCTPARQPGQSPCAGGVFGHSGKWRHIGVKSSSISEATVHAISSPSFLGRTGAARPSLRMSAGVEMVICLVEKQRRSEKPTDAGGSALKLWPLFRPSVHGCFLAPLFVCGGARGCFVFHVRRHPIRSD
jgi:hypothetical protein